jgi:hypothetical protein
MENFIHQRNLAHYRKLLAETAHEPLRGQIQRLLAEEEKKELQPSGPG